MNGLKKIIVLSAAGLVGIGATVACESELDNKPSATVAPADGKKAETPAKGEEKKGETPAKAEGDKAPAGDAKAAPAGALKVDAAASSIEFVGAKVTGDHTGKFEKFDGSLTLKDGKPAAIEFTVQMDTVKTDAEKLDGHLKSPDFFDVAKFPTSTFKSTAIAASTAEGATHSITGDLELHGVKKSITFPATVTGNSGKAEFKINRKDFKIEYPGKPDDLIKDDVLLKLNLVFPKA
jgi:polyisoprenoid-binding protein YceI